MIGSLAVTGQLRDRLARSDGEALVGTVVTLPDVGLAELTASAVDLVWIDLEHGALSLRDVQPLAIAAHSAGAASLVRLRGGADSSIDPALDAGVDGVVVPRMERAVDAERVVARLRYPPDGSRGSAARRASAYGSAAAGPRTHPVCMVQIESQAAVHAAPEIARIEGVDALIVGCADLALDLGSGATGGRLREAMAHVRTACAESDSAFGIAGPDDPERIVELARPRADVLVLGADVRLYARALRGALARLRHEPAHGASRPEEARVGT